MAKAHMHLPFESMWHTAMSWSSPVLMQVCMSIEIVEGRIILAQSAAILYAVSVWPISRL
jgi:hypothetical protein